METAFSLFSMETEADGNRFHYAARKQRLNSKVFSLYSMETEG